MSTISVGAITHNCPAKSGRLHRIEDSVNCVLKIDFSPYLKCRKVKLSDIAIDITLYIYIYVTLLHSDYVFFLYLYCYFLTTLLYFLCNHA